MITTNRFLFLFMSMGSWFFAGFDFIIISALAYEYGAIFFPNPNPTSTILLVYGTLSLSLLGRVLGGVFFNRLSDRYGRRPVILTTSIFLTAVMFIFAVYLNNFYSYVLDQQSNSMMNLVMISPVIFIVLRMTTGFLIGGIWPTAGTLAIENLFQDYKYKDIEKGNEDKSRKQLSLIYFNDIKEILDKEDIDVLDSIIKMDKDLQGLFNDILETKDYFVPTIDKVYQIRWIWNKAKPKIIKKDEISNYLDKLEKAYKNMHAYSDYYSPKSTNDSPVSDLIIYIKEIEKILYIEKLRILEHSIYVKLKEKNRGKIECKDSLQKLQKNLTDVRV
jgi:hypothetical protein